MRASPALPDQSNPCPFVAQKFPTDARTDALADVHRRRRYIHGLRAWGTHFPSSQLLVLRSEALFDDTPATMARVQAFLGLRAPFSSDALRSASNRNTHASRSAPSSVLEKRLDDFFAPFNAQLYEWLRAKGMDAHFGRWEEADPLAPRAKV